MFFKYSVTEQTINKLKDWGLSLELIDYIDEYKYQDLNERKEIIQYLQSDIDREEDEFQELRQQEGKILIALEEHFTLFFWMVGISTLLCGGWFFVAVSFFPPVDKDGTVTSWSISTIGNLGDSFGSLTSLFTALAFAGMIWSISMQRKELSLQRRELSLTRQEMESQRKEFKGQKQALENQTAAMNATLLVNEQQLALDSKQFELSQRQFTIEHETWVSRILQETLNKDRLHEFKVGVFDHYGEDKDIAQANYSAIRRRDEYLKDYFNLVNQLQTSFDKKKHEKRLHDFLKNYDTHLYNEIVQDLGHNWCKYFENLPENP